MAIFRSIEGVGTISSCNSLTKQETCPTNPTAEFFHWAKVGLILVSEPNIGRENGVTLRPFSLPLGLEERSASPGAHGHVGYG